METENQWTVTKQADLLRLSLCKSCRIWILDAGNGHCIQMSRKDFSLIMLTAHQLYVINLVVLSNE